MWPDLRSAPVSPRAGQNGRTLNLLKFWNKLDALAKAMKHLGLFERDNAQQRESLVLRVEAARLVVEAAELVGLRSVNGLCRALGWRLG